jgi:hypothetical protein
VTPGPSSFSIYDTVPSFSTITAKRAVRSGPTSQAWFLAKKDFVSARKSYA